jgi:APA family basic amino acid/polyamine antiporter
VSEKEGKTMGEKVAGPTLYTRQATGLVREIGLSSNVALNVSFISLPLAGFVATQAPFAFPGSNLVGIVIITAILCIAPTLLYGLLAQAMPRSGGDYVFVSRIIHPMVGFVANFNITMWFQLVIALMASYVATLGLSPALASIGEATGNTALVDAATTGAGKEWQFAIGAVILILVALLMSLRLQLAMRIFQVLFYLSLVGIVIAMILTVTNERAAFEAAVQKFGGDYNGMIAAATAAGWPGYSKGIDWGATLGATPLLFASFGYAIVSTYAAGEIRQAKTTILRGLLLALGISVVFVLVMLGFAARTFGEEWMGAANYLALTAPDQYTLPAFPGYLFFSTMLTDNAPLIALMTLSYALAFVVALPPTFLIATRSLFAWSFDRIFPERVSSVNDRTHSPVVANVVVLVLTLVFLTITVFGPADFLTLLYTAGAAELLTFIVVAIAGTIFPFRRPELFAASPIASKIAGIATITLVGIAAAIVYVIFLIPLLTNSALGANATPGLVGMLVIFVIPIVIYPIAYFVRRRNGVDLSLAFQSLPPE